MLGVVYMASELATSPADEIIQTGTQSDKKVWLEVANLSPYVFELRDEAGQVRGLAGAFTYYSVLLKPFTPTITLHAVATSTSLPFSSSGYAVYAGLTQNEPSVPPRFG